MSKHNKKRRYRKIGIAAVVIAAVGTPTVAMACMDGQDKWGNESQGRWKNASYDGKWSKSTWSPKPTAAASQPATATPTATPTATASATATVAATSSAAAVVKLVNSERSKAGCAPVTINAKLTKAAQDHSKDMAAHRNMSHTGSDGSSAGERITRAGYSWRTYGENVAYGYSTPDRVMAGWMSSSGHKRNILNCAFKEIGVGLAQPGDYWTQDFATAR